MSRSAIIVAFLMTVCAATIRAGQVSNAAVSYVVQSAKTARADVKIVTAPSEHARAIIVTLPFTSKGIATRSHGALIGFATSDLGSAVIAIVPANRNSFIFSCDVDLAGATTSTVRVAQYPDKLVLVVPPPSPALLNEFTLGASDIEVVSTFTSINARLPSGFTVAGENSDVQERDRWNL